MNIMLPDVSLTETASILHPLEWVGMQGIDLPLIVAEPNYKREVHARADVQVDLPDPQVKGIHMSRLYRLLDDGLSGEAVLKPGTLQGILRDMINSHNDCGSDGARLSLTFDLLVRRPALVTEGLSGWNSYPVRIDAVLMRGEMKVSAEVIVEYSSTCPCSAALSRQIVEQAFREAFSSEDKIDLNTAASWLSDNATLATPHSQRSEAKVSVIVDNLAPDLGLLALIDCVEQAVATPVQTAVKRADEQAFAALNGQNLMFVEDAVRRLEEALTDYNSSEVFVRHIESLHPHDAVAWSRTV